MRARNHLPVLFAAVGGVLLAGAAFAGSAPPGLGDKNVNVDPRTSFPGGTAPGEAASSLGVSVGGQLSRSTMIGHPATEDIATGWGGTTVPPDAGRVGGTAGRIRR